MVSEVLECGIAVVVIDDGSTDGTADTVRDLPVQVVTHEENLGKGAALRSGFAWALAHGYEGVVTLDADGQHDPTAIVKLALEAERLEADILIGSRYAQFNEMAGLRAWWNRFGVWCMRKRTGFEITDSQSGFRWYSARLLRQLTLQSNGYQLEMEILMKAWRHGFFIASLPVPARVADGRGTSHFRPVRDTWRICKIFLRNM
ncbi:glycosyltransferase family 2 protein [Geobacter sp. DSM 9736]|uniref:glycosyltransferase family 2 protein n=1 Tax=Geobacter sp. DSM 9736 TaxID=1277350 RepID=UPI001E39D42C|nr:glycosyltransferase family 2 protein [Geobacter sp. DSM 9736]